MAASHQRKTSTRKPRRQAAAPSDKFTEVNSLASGARDIDRTSESPIRTLHDIKDDLEVINETIQSTLGVTESLTLPTSISLQISAENILTAQHEDYTRTLASGPSGVRPCALVTPGHNEETRAQHRCLRCEG